MARYEPSTDLNERAADAFAAPAADAVAAAIAADVRLTGPLDIGILRAEAGYDRAVPVGPSCRRAVAHSTRPSADGRHDVAAYVEFGTRYMTPRRYMARSARDACAALRLGSFDRAPDPWPHR